MLAVCVAAKLRAFLFIRHCIGRLQAGKAVGLSVVFQFEPPPFFRIVLYLGGGIGRGWGLGFGGGLGLGGLGLGIITMGLGLGEYGCILYLPVGITLTPSSFIITMGLGPKLPG